MPAKNQSNTSQRMQIVDFLDIDTSKITFKQPKLNKYNGSQIGILYNGETMYVKYEGYVLIRFTQPNVNYFTLQFP